MILFQTRHHEVYNYIIHHLLEIEVFNGDTDIGDVIEDFLPKYLFREQYLKCIKILKEVFLWTEDSFYHQMSAFHELIIYYFLDYMSDLQGDLPDFKELN